MPPSPCKTIGLVTLVVVLFGCERQPEVDPHKPQPFSQMDEVVQRRASLRRVLGALNEGPPGRARKVVAELLAWSPIDLNIEWKQLGPTLRRACDSGRLVLDQQLVDFFAHQGTRGLELLGCGMRSEDSAIREQCAHHLAKAGDEGLKLLIASLAEGDRTLTRIALDVLAERIASDRPPVRMVAAQFLWRLAVVLEDTIDGDDPLVVLPAALGDAVGRLCALLDDSDAAVRITSLEMLGNLGPRAHSAAPRVAELMRDPEPAVALSARDVIHRFGPLAVAELLPHLSDPDAELRRATVVSLSRIGRQAPAPIRNEVAEALLSSSRDAESNVRLEVYRALVALTAQPRVERALAAGLADADREVGREVAELLGRLEASPTVVRALAAAVGMPDEQLGRNALSSLAKLGSGASSAVPTIERACLRGPIGLRTVALDALVATQRNSERWMAVLKKLMADKHPELRMMAVKKTGELGPALFVQAGALKKPVQQLLDQMREISFNDPDPQVKRAAVEAFGKLHASRASSGRGSGHSHGHGSGGG